MQILLTCAVSLFCVVLFPATSNSQDIVKDQVLQPWKKGWLDIHHINTGRGNCTFSIFPDGTTLLIDAGELSPLDNRIYTPRNASIKPDSTKKPYEWISAYIRKVHPVPENTKIDYAVITHFHDDHFGAWYPGAPLSRSIRYVLTGITGVAEYVPVKILIDRGYPEYAFPYDIKQLASRYAGGELAFDSTMKNYFAFIDEKKKAGMKVEPFVAGRKYQVRLINDAQSYPNFHVQNVKSNEWIWNGSDSLARRLYNYIPATSVRMPDENMLSLALTINYGDFVYYTGGDNPGNLSPGDQPERDVETPISRVVGQVDVATMDHHGNRDAVNEYMIKTLSPRIWIGQTWSADHPGHEVLLRLTNRNINPDTSDIFATNMLEANRHVIGPLIDRSYKSQQGHILVRVLPGGQVFYVIVLHDSDMSMAVKNVFGPYYTKKKLK